MQCVSAQTSRRFSVDEKTTCRQKKSIYGAIGTPLAYPAACSEISSIDNSKGTDFPLTDGRNIKDLPSQHQTRSAAEPLPPPSNYRQKSFTLFSFRNHHQQCSGDCSLGDMHPRCGCRLLRTQDTLTPVWSSLVPTGRQTKSTPVPTAAQWPYSDACTGLSWLHRSLVHRQETREAKPKIDNSIKLLADSVAFMSLGTTKTMASHALPVVKVSNIPWSISLAEIRDILKHVDMPNENDVAQNIHVIINKTTGKTKADAYVEVATEDAVLTAIRKHRHAPIRGRRLYVSQSSQEALMKELFSEWPGACREGKATLPPPSDKKEAAAPPPLIQQKELESLLTICRNFKSYFSRKCGERPFENFISLMVKFPWHQPHIITTLQRDHLYEYYKLATNVLRMHLSKPNINLDPSLMTRMIRAALQCPGLTTPQKRRILAAGDVACPPELQHCIEVASGETSPHLTPAPTLFTYPDPQRFLLSDMLKPAHFNEPNSFPSVIRPSCNQASQ